MVSIKYGFLFNHDAVHQVAHTAPIMEALRELDLESAIVALVSSSAQASAIEQIVGCSKHKKIDIKILEIPVLLRQIFRLLNRILPAQRLYILRKYCAYFSTLDGLIVPEMTSALLKTKFNLKSTSLILFPHGAGDRAIGFGSEIRHFDYVLLAGSKIRDRMMRKNLIQPENHQIVGYPKFDAVRAQKAPRKRFFDNNRLTVLYNPHFDARLSSWYRFGEDILRFFAERPNMNLIFAPHVMLFKKKVHFAPQSHQFRFRKSIPKKYFNYPNILIDTGSRYSVDMTYTINCDVYLGDASSQVYEFLINPRPCIFLNSHGAQWKNNADYQHWTLGPVLDSLSSLEDLLSGSPIAFHDEFSDLQIRAIRETFNLTSTPSSMRAAQAVFQFLQTGRRITKTSPEALSSRRSPKTESDSLAAGISN
jgi:hypothetical protein